MTDPAAFGEVDGLIDEQLYEHKRKANFDPHDDDEWCVSLTAKQWRTVERALAIANGMATPVLGKHCPACLAIPVAGYCNLAGCPMTVAARQALETPDAV